MSESLAPETYELLSRRGIQEALRVLDLRPSRRLGQHFLVEPAVLQQILQAAGLTLADTALEIGPGLGVLTSELLRRAGRVVAVELDRRLADWLRRRFAEVERLTLVEDDLLRLDVGALMAPFGEYQVVANLPYAITSAALRHLLEADPQPTQLVLMVQWEVARRITADPPDMSLLALSVQYYARAKLVTRVPAGCFLPAPQVDSAVLRLRVAPQPRVELPPAEFFRLVRAGFRQPRRQLANNLAAGLGRPKVELAALLEELGIDPRRRAETLSLEEWGRLGQRL